MIREIIYGYLTKICAYSSRGMTIWGERDNKSLQTGIQQRTFSPAGATGTKAV